MSSPAKATVPANGTNPLMASMKVVLPAPFGPIRPTSWPSSTSRSTSIKARTPPNETEMLRAARTLLIRRQPPFR
jgi:hypothetical protein